MSQRYAVQLQAVGMSTAKLRSRFSRCLSATRLTAGQADAVRARTEAILAASNPGAPDDPASWPRWTQLMPHVLAADLAATGIPGLRELACDGCHYLLARADTRTAHDLASDLHQQWRDPLGDNHEHVLAIARYLAWALRLMGRYTEAHDLGQDILDRRRRVLGENHPDTLASASNLATDLRALGKVQAARDLDQDTLDRRRRVLGENHPSTLTSARNLAIDLRALGEVDDSS